MEFINCEIELDLKWTKNCVNTAAPNTNLVRYEVVTATTGATFQIANTKIHVPVVTFSINDNIKFLETIK